MVDNYLNSIDYAIIALYLATIVTLGFHLKRRASASLEQYLVGGRSMPWWMLGVSGVMDFWDLSGTMIIVSFLFLLGPRGLFIEFRGGAVLVLAVIMLWAGKWHRRSGCLTAAEWMVFRFGDGPAGRAAQLARAIAGIIVTVGMIAYLVKGTGLFLSTFLPFTPAQGALALVACATVYTMMSGFYGVVIIHFLQLGIVVAAAITLIWLGFHETDSFQSLRDLATRVTGNPDWTAAAPTVRAVMPPGYEPYESLMLFAVIYLVRNVIYGMGAGDDPKYFAAKSDADCAKLTLLWTCLISLRWPMMIGIAVLGLGAASNLLPDPVTTQRAAEIIHARYPQDHDWATLTAVIGHNPEKQPPELIADLKETLGEDWQTKLLLVSPYGTVNPERVMPAVLLLTIPPGLRALVVVSLIAAAMAGFGAWVNQSAGFFVHDIYQKHLRPNAAVSELMLATWVFIAAMVTAGFLFAFSARNINDVWAWLMMGLGGGMMMPQLLPLYWKRFNGVGYTVGTAAGVAGALALRLAKPWLGDEWAFLNDEQYLLPLLAAVGLAASMIGAWLTAPTPEPVLRNFYRTTLPFGFWAPYPQQLPEPLRGKVRAEHRRDVLALPVALAFQILIFLTPMLALIRNWPAFGVCAALAALSFAALYFIWIRRIDESDVIAAEARATLGHVEATPH